MTLLQTANATLKAADRQRVRVAYSNSYFYHRRNGRGGLVEVCRVQMEPIPSPDELSFVLADLEDAEAVNIGPLGKIRHSPHCRIDFVKHRRNLPTVRLADRSFTVELEYPTRFLGEAGSIHPRLRVIHPEISQKTHPNHPHLYYDKWTGDSWACPIWAQDATWQWDLGGTVNYLDNCSIWLLKTEVWVATGGRIFTDFGRWVGPAASHHPLDILKETDLEGPCPCGNGRIFNNCCFVRQAIRAIELRN